MSRRRFALALALPLAFGCSSAPPPPPPAAPPTPLPPTTTVEAEPAGAPAESVIGWDVTSIDTSVQACDDFYQFACGKWLARTPIPEDRPAWGRSFAEINERNQQKLHDILEKYAAGTVDAADDAENARKVGDLYATCMDEAKAETASVATLRETIGKIDGVKDGAALARVVAELHLAGVGVFFDYQSDQDFKDATQVIGAVDQSGIGMPERDYYLKEDARSVELRGKYVAHVAKMLKLGGTRPDAAMGDAKTVLAFETALAKASMPIVDRRDPNKVYHRLERAGLEKKAPHFAWKTYFETIGTPKVTAINVAVPEFVAAISDLVAAGKWDDIRAYLRWHLLHASAPALGKQIVDENFAWSEGTLRGVPAMLPRWKRCARAADVALGEALAQPFVRDTFGADGKERSRTMIDAIELAFEQNLAGLDWMDDATRAQALGKQKKIMNKVGYPDHWRDYSKLEIDRTSHLRNMQRASAFELRRLLAKIGKPVNRAEWRTTPPTVNAYYNPQLNEMVFPAGILQPPFFTRTAADAVNYGAIGMVMGHELTHGFDDQGRQFDAVGNLREWWTPAAAKAYAERADCVVKQYDGYLAVGDQHVNGKLTLGENIADLGGLKFAYAAQRAARAARGAAPPVGGYSEDQQFFIAYAQAWCTNRRESYARVLANTDPHSPPQFRVNGALSDLPEFAAAFSCPIGSKMVPPKRCQVW